MYRRDTRWAGKWDDSIAASFAPKFASILIEYDLRARYDQWGCHSSPFDPSFSADDTITMRVIVEMMHKIRLSTEFAADSTLIMPTWRHRSEKYDRI